MAHGGGFGGGFDGAVGVEGGANVAGWGGGLEEEAEFGGEGVVGVEVGVDGREGGGAEELGEDGGEGGDGVGFVGVEDVEGGAEAGPWAGPLFGGGVFGAAEEVEGKVGGGGAGLGEDGDGVGLEEAGEVEEVGLLAVGVEDGAGAVLEFGGGEDGDGVGGEARGEAGAAVVVFLGGDAGGDWGCVSRGQGSWW